MGFCVMELSSIEDPVVRQALARNQEQRKEERGREEVNAMPRGDRTGPMGMGPMTGRAAGYCAGYGVPGYANPTTGCTWYPGALPGYGAIPNQQAYAPYGAAPVYGVGWGRPLGWWFAGGFGRGFSRGFGGGFGRGRGRGRGRMGW